MAQSDNTNIDITWSRTSSWHSVATPEQVRAMLLDALTVGHSDYEAWRAHITNATTAELVEIVGQLDTDADFATAIDRAEVHEWLGGREFIGDDDGPIIDTAEPTSQPADD